MDRSSASCSLCLEKDSLLLLIDEENGDAENQEEVKVKMGDQAKQRAGEHGLHQEEPKSLCWVKVVVLLERARLRLGVGLGLGGCD